MNKATAQKKIIDILKALKKPVRLEVLGELAEIEQPLLGEAGRDLILSGAAHLTVDWKLALPTK